MNSSLQPPAGAARRRRSDADRSVSAILEAAIDALGEDPDVSMAEIARRAGVVRATIYVHFPTRDALIAAITERAMAAATEALRAAKPDEGDPVDALERMIAAAWRTLGPYHALVQINTQLGPEHIHAIHQPVLRLIRPMIKRGQATGAFNRDLPVAWTLTVLLELMHAASREVRMGKLTDRKAEQALIATITAAVAAPGHPRRVPR